MKSPICVTNISVTNTKQIASLSIAGWMLAIMPLWLMLAAAGTLVQAQATSSPADWTQFLRDNMQRWNPYETVLSVNSLETRGLKLNWQSPTGNFYDSASSPVLANGVVYYGSFDYSGSALTGHVYALNASTGAQLWSFETPGPVTSSPAVANGVVYVSSESLYALNASTGALLWSSATAGNGDSPTVANGVVYVSSQMCSSNGVPCTSSLYALNASTGALLWSFPMAGNGSSPAVANGVVYVGSSDDNVYALNASTGEKLWNYSTDGEVTSSPAVANGVVYVGSSTGVAYALGASTGALLWRYAAASTQSLGTAPAVANGVVYFEANNSRSCCQKNNSYLYALNTDSGALLWAYPTSGQGFSSPAVANGVLYFTYEGILSGEGNNANELYAVNAATGALLWSYLSPVFIVSSPIIGDGVLYFRTGNTFPPALPAGTPSGEIYAFGLGADTADLFLRIRPTPTTVQQGDLITYAFPVWNLGPGNAFHEVLTTQVPEGTTLDYVRISGTPGLGTCTTPPYGGTGEIVCHENSAMAPNTTWTVRVVVKVTAPAGTVINESATTTEDTPDPNLANNTATVSIPVE